MTNIQSSKLRRRARPRKGCAFVANSFSLSSSYHYEVYDNDGNVLCTLDAAGTQDALRLARGAGLQGAISAAKVQCAAV